jgi:hypothetical protein
MAMILSGIYRGHKCEIHQFCNDWFSVDVDNGSSVILSPLQIKLNMSEIGRVMREPNVGMMFVKFDLHRRTGIFKKKYNPKPRWHLEGDNLCFK